MIKKINLNKYFQINTDNMTEIVERLFLCDEAGFNGYY